jgi:predicted RNA binding protein YcfA (HicA-like mRNA interferase family)
MTRIAKPYDQLIEGRPISFAEFERLLHAFGFKLDRTKGSHKIFKHPNFGQRVNAQPKGKFAKPYQVRQFLDIIEENGLSLED